MTDNLNLEGLYSDAQQALKRREYGRAAALLKQILLIDDDYKDASQLLAQAVRLRRRRWYNDARVWGTLGALILIGAGAWLGPKLMPMLTRLAAPEASPSVLPSPTLKPIPTETLAPTEPPLPTPTAIPLAWKRINLGLDFPRDLITAIAIDPRDPAVLYIGTDSAGVYKSIDGGESFQPAYKGLEHAAITTLLIDPTDPRIVYAEASGAVYKSVDGGGSWANLTGEFFTDPQAKNSLFMDSLDSKRLYFGAPGTLLITRDGGVTWTNAWPDSVPSECTNSPRVLLAEGNLIYLAADQVECPRLFRSVDGGATWVVTDWEQQLLNGRLDQLIGVTDDSGRETLYAVFDNKQEWNILAASFDGGNTWEHHRAGCTSLAVDGQNNGYVLCRGTFSALPSWGTIGQAPVQYAQRLIVSPHDANTIYVSGQEGLYVSKDGGRAWEVLSNGLGMRPVELKVRPGYDELFLQDTLSSAMDWFNGRVCSLYRSRDRGTRWDLLVSMEGTCRLSFGPQGAVLYGSGGVSTNGGDSWIDSQLGSYVPHPLSEGWFYAEGWYSNSRYSSDSGKTWLSGNLKNRGLLIFDMQNEDRIYSASATNIWVSIDRGRNWQSCGMYEALSPTDTRMALDPRDGQRIYLATSGRGLLISNDGCVSWNGIEGSVTGLFVNTVAVDPGQPDTVYIGTDSGVYVSFDRGETWNQINDGLLGATVVYSIVVDAQSNVYAATPYGIFRLEGK